MTINDTLKTLGNQMKTITEIRQQIINAAFEYLDAALPKSDCIDGAVLKRAEKLAEML